MLRELIPYVERMTQIRFGPGVQKIVHFLYSHPAETIF